MYRTYATLVQFDMPDLDLELFVCHFRILVKRAKKLTWVTENQWVIITIWAGRCKDHTEYQRKATKREARTKRKALYPRRFNKEKTDIFVHLPLVLPLGADMPIHRSFLQLDDLPRGLRSHCTREHTRGTGE